jgi:nicotinamidase-related amidase
LSRTNTALLVIDVQEKLFPLVERSDEILYKLRQAVQGFQILGLPIYVTEQYPQGLGEVVPDLKCSLGPTQVYFSKTTFSCLADEKIKGVLVSQPVNQWVVSGIEAHVCVLQTVKELLKTGHEVVVLNDAISSRSIYDYSTAIAEMRDYGARISSTETVLFELVHDSKAPEFKQISQLIK